MSYYLMSLMTGVTAPCGDDFDRAIHIAAFNSHPASVRYPTKEVPILFAVRNEHGDVFVPNEISKLSDAIQWKSRSVAILQPIAIPFTYLGTRPANDANYVK